MTKHPVRLVRNFGLLFSANVGAQLLQLIALVHLARVLGPAAFGLWGLAQAWMLSLLRVGEMGLEVIGIRTVAVEPGAVREITWDVLVQRLVLAALVLAAIPAAMVFDIFPAASGSLIFLLSLVLLPTAVSLEWVFEAHQRVGPVGAARLLRGVAFVVPVVVLVHSEAGLFNAAWLYVASVAAATLFAMVMAARAYRLVPPTFELRRALGLLREAAPVGGATLLSQYSMFAGTILAGYLVSAQELGLYAAGHRPLVFIWAYGIVTSNRVILPHLSRVFTSSPDQFRDFVRKYVWLLSMVAIPLALGGIVGGSAIVTTVFGEEFQGSAPVFSILSGAIALAVVRSVLEVGLIASNRQALVLRGMIGLAVIMTGATYGGFHWNGIVGAAWGGLVAEAAYAAYLVGVFRSLGTLEILRVVWKPAAVAAVLAAGAGLLGAESLVEAGALLGAYLGALVVTRQLSMKDLRLLREALSPGRKAPE